LKEAVEWASNQVETEIGGAEGSGRHQKTGDDSRGVCVVDAHNQGHEERAHAVEQAEYQCTHALCPYF
jgi:hypothetical protein